MNETDVQDGLFRYFNAYRGYHYQLCNAFVFRWESDFFCIASSGYSYEIEVKVSRGDFWADLKKERKHVLLANKNEFLVEKQHIHPGIENWAPEARAKWEKGDRLYRPKSRIKVIRRGDTCPNRFLYAVPHGLVTPEETPPYAGLVYVPDDARRKPIIVKKPPSIHTHKRDFTKVLLKKYYWAYLNKLGHKKAGKNFTFPDQQRQRMVRTA